MYEDPIAKIFAEKMEYVGTTKELSISNLTKLDIQSTYGIYGIENFVFVPPVVSYGKRLIGAATLGEQMNITFHFLKNENYEKEFALFQKAISYLSLN